MIKEISMNLERHLNLAALIFILMSTVPAISADSNTEIDFEKQILPILQNRCFSCHSAPKSDTSEAPIRKPKGGVQLDSVAGIGASQHGEVIIAGEPEDSLLYQRITLPVGETGIMPPSEEGHPLTEEQTDLIRKWIKDGANYGEWVGIQRQAKTYSNINNHHQPNVMPPITSLVFSPDGKKVVACSQAGLHVYDLPTLNLLRTIEVKAHNIHKLAYSPSGDRLAVGGGNPAVEGIIEIFSWPKLESQSILKEHRDSVTAVAWIDASSLVSASLDRRVILWDLSTETPIQELNGHSKGVSSLCFLSNKDILVSTGIDQSVRVWDLESGKLIRSMNNHTQPVHDLALRPSDTELPVIVSAGDDRTVRFWQPSIGRMVKFVRLNSAPLSVAWLNDGSKVVTACTDGVIRLVDPDLVEVTKEIPTLNGWVYTLAVHPTDGSIVIGGVNGQVRRVIPK